MVMGRLVEILEIVDGGESQWISGWSEEMSGCRGIWIKTPVARFFLHVDFLR